MSIAPYPGVDPTTPGASLHTFRHAVVTMVSEAGHMRKDARVLVGHATDRMTSRIYSHQRLTGTQRIADTMQDIFGDIHAADSVLTADESPWNTQTDRFVGRAMGQAGQKPSSSAS